MTNKNFDDFEWTAILLVCLAILIGVCFGLEEISQNKHHAEVMEQIKVCTAQVK